MMKLPAPLTYVRPMESKRSRRKPPASKVMARVAAMWPASSARAAAAAIWPVV